MNTCQYICEDCLSLRGAQDGQLESENEQLHFEININDLPKELVEYILSLIPPYRNLRNCRLVCKLWLDLIDDLVLRQRGKFVKSIMGHCSIWKEYSFQPCSTITARYSHATCYYKDYLYVFGGATYTQTTFNDLSKFDLNERRWIRPLVTGTYPTPKSASTLVPYKNQLILFGGLNRPPIYRFETLARLNNEVHLYDIDDNTWTELETLNNPLLVAGHRATIHNDTMVVFGGRVFVNNTNDVWVLDLITKTWWKPETTSPKPEPRNGHTQIAIDDNNLLIIGGSNGPNNVLSDIWLLTFATNKNDLWKWTKVLSKNPELQPEFYNHIGCKVDSYVAFLGKPPVQNCHKTPSYPFHNLRRRSIELKHSDNSYRVRMENCCSDKCNLHHMSKKCKICGRMFAVRYCNPTKSLVESSKETATLNKCVRNTVMPSVKPNSLKNRQRQLEGCDRMERRLRSLAKSSSDESQISSENNMCNFMKPDSMALYVMDVSKVLEKQEVEWNCVSAAFSPPPTLLYSMDCSGIEIIMFGGIRHTPTAVDDSQVIQTNLSNSVYILSNKPVIR